VVIQRAGHPPHRVIYIKDGVVERDEVKR